MLKIEAKCPNCEEIIYLTTEYSLDITYKIEEEIPTHLTDIILKSYFKNNHGYVGTCKHCNNQFTVHQSIPFMLVPKETTFLFLMKQIFAG